MDEKDKPRLILNDGLSPASEHLSEDSRDSVSPLPSIATRYNFRSTTRQESIRLINVLNGEMEKSWVISPMDLKKPSYSSLASPIGVNNLARRFSQSPVGLQKIAKKRILANDPKPVGYHRVQDMFDDEFDPSRSEIQSERVVTSFFKHETMTSIEDLHPESMKTDKAEKNHDLMSMEFDLLPSSLISPRTSRLDSSSDAGSSVSESFMVPKSKRKLSEQSSPETRFEPYKKAYLRPGTPSPSTSVPGSPWRNYLTTDKLKKFKRSIDISKDDLLSSRKRAMSIPSVPHGSKISRLSSISSDMAELGDDERRSVDLDDKDSVSVASTSREYQEKYEWRQTDDDEFEYEQNYE